MCLKCIVVYKLFCFLSFLIKIKSKSSVIIDICILGILCLYEKWKQKFLKRCLAEYIRAKALYKFILGIQLLDLILMEVIIRKAQHETNFLQLINQFV